jgi:hypothetical protein
VETSTLSSTPADARNGDDVSQFILFDALFLLWVKQGARWSDLVDPCYKTTIADYIDDLGPALGLPQASGLNFP